MTIKATLIQNGLSGREAQVYLALLALQESSPAEIAKRSRIKRPTVYVILERLMEQGLVSRVVRGARLRFRALNPTALLESRHRHFEALRAAMPELHDIYKAGDSNPHMTVFEGREGLIQMMEDTLGADGEILSWADVDSIVHGAFKTYWRTYIKKRVAKQIRTRCIFNSNVVSAGFSTRERSELREAVHVPPGQYPMSNEINIYNDKVAIISHRDLVGVILQNSSLAETQRSIFNLCYNLLKAR